MGKLLVMDDSTELLEALEIIFESNGYTVMTISNTGDIYTAIREFNPDVLLIDILLGGEDGREICRELKKDNANKDLGILLFSANLNYLKDFASYCADDFIAKPFDIGNLLEKVKKVLELRNARKIAGSM